MTNNNTNNGIDVVLKNSAGQYLIPYTREKYRGGAYSMFDPVIKNRILSYNELQGFAQAGSYFYKEALAGTRYGYPDSYQKIIDWYEDATDLVSLKNNITVSGALNVNNGVLSGFSTTKYATFTTNYTTSASESFEIQIKINKGSLSADGRIMNILGGTESPSGLYIQGASLSFYNGTTTVTFPAVSALQDNTDYLLKWVYDGTNVKGYYSTTDESDYTLYSDNLSGFAPNFANANYSLGIRSYDCSSSTVWNGSIDLKQCYINIDVVRRWTGSDNAVKHENGMQFYDISLKSTVDDIYSTTGEADMWGVDITNERIFTPRIDNLIFDSGNEHLYYIVGNTYEWTGLSEVVQSGTDLLNQVSSGITASINTRVKLDGSNAQFPYIEETYVNGTSWYRIWSDGWCEQGNAEPKSSSFVTSNKQRYFLKEYANTDYVIFCNAYTTSSNLDSGYFSALTKATDSFTTAYNTACSWMACGYIR